MKFPSHTSSCCRWTAARAVGGQEDALLGWDLDDVLEGPDVVPVIEPVERESQVVEVPTLTDEERWCVRYEYQRDRAVEHEARGHLGKREMPQPSTPGEIQVAHVEASIWHPPSEWLLSGALGRNDAKRILRRRRDYLDGQIRSRTPLHCDGSLSLERAERSAIDCVLAELDKPP